MAFTAQTDEIIARLKAEGDLTRNTGTNSMRSVKTQLSKFDGVFNSINANIAEQTSIMKAQLGIAQDAAALAATQEQFDEIDSKSSKEGPEYNAQNSSDDGKEANEKIDRMGDKIAGALSFKNLLMGGAAAFAGYNVLKGFVDEKTGGGFSAFEDGVAKFGRDIANTDLAQMQAQFDGIAENMSSMTGSMETLASAADRLMGVVEKIENFGWDDLGLAIGAAITGMGLLSAYNVTGRVLDKLIPAKAGGTPVRRTLLQRLLRRPIVAATATAGGMLAAGAAAGNIPERAATNVIPDKPPVVSGAPNQPKAPNIDIMDSGSGRFTYRDADTNRFISRASAESRLAAAGLGPDGLPTIDRAPVPRPVVPDLDPRGRNQINPDSTGTRGKLDLGREGGKQVAEANRGIIRKMATAKIGKVILMGIPLVGAVVGAGFALFNLARGDFTSAALQGGSIPLPSISGTGLDLASVSTEIFFSVTGEPYNQAREDHRAIMIEIGAELKLAYDEWMANESNRKQAEFDLLPQDERARTMAAQEALVGRGLPGGTDTGFLPSNSDIYGTDYYGNKNTSNSIATTYVDNLGNLMRRTPDGREEMLMGKQELSSQRMEYAARAQEAAAVGGITIINNNNTTPVVNTSVSSNDRISTASFVGSLDAAHGYGRQGLSGAVN